MMSWKNKHFSLLPYFKILNFWNNDYLILPIFLPKPSSDKLPLIPSCSKWISWAYFRKKLKIQWDARVLFSTASKIRGVTVTPRRGLRGGDPLPWDFRLIVCLTPPQMNDFCDLLGTPYAPVSKIAPVKSFTYLFRKL